MIHILQCDPQVPSGIYGAYLEHKAIPHRLVRLFADEPLPAVGAAALVLGGTMGVHDEADFPFLRPLKVFMRQTAEAGVPLFGICLGGQLLAAALGGTVTARSRGEKGMTEIVLTAAGVTDPLFAGLPERFGAFAWHNDSFDLPPGTPHLAFSATCPGQAFRVGKAYGLQFHPEVDAATVAAWSAQADPEGRRLADFREAEAVCRPICLCLFENFLRLLPLAQPASRVA
jgi:GMP synthase-like glutamine amidotransferase